MLLTGLDWKYFNWRQMEFHGNLNLLKTGMVFADSINTVSPRYAQEIQSSPLGCGLEGVLQYPARRAFRDSQRHRPARMEPGQRSAPARELHARDGEPGQADLQGGAAEGTGAAAGACRPAGGHRGPADRPEGVRPGGRRHAALGADERRAVGDPGHGPAEVPQAAGDPGRALPAESGRCAWSSPTRWPIASRPAPTSSSCPAASSPAG